MNRLSPRQGWLRRIRAGGIAALPRQLHWRDLTPSVKEGRMTPVEVVSSGTVIAALSVQKFWGK